MNSAQLAVAIHGNKGVGKWRNSTKPDVDLASQQLVAILHEIAAILDIEVSNNEIDEDSTKLPCHHSKTTLRVEVYSPSARRR